MEILKSLNERQLDGLRAAFDSAPYSSLDEQQFKKLLRETCKDTDLSFTTRYLARLFASVDVTGRGRVGWNEFSMFAIEQANITEEDGLTTHRAGKARANEKRSAKKDGAQTKTTKDDGEPSRGRSDSRSGSSSSLGSEDAERFSDDVEMELDVFSTFRPFSVDSVIPHPFGKQVNLARYYQRQRRLVVSMNDVKGSSHVTVYDVHDGGQGMSIHGRLPKQPEVVVDWDMIPATGGVGFSNSLVCAYQGGVVQLFSLQKKHSVDEVLPFSKSLIFSETQTRLVWSSLYNRLLLGSRGGVLSIWDVDGDSVFTQEKLHTEAVTRLVVRSGSVFSSSLDRFNSVKIVDVEHSVVTNAFNDHMLGGSTALAVSDDSLFSGGFESKIVQRTLQTPRAQPSFLYDTSEPHTGRLTCLELLPNSPLLLSSDSHGLLKVWDLRVGACLQTMTPASAGGHKARQEKERRHAARQHSRHRGGAAGAYASGRGGAGLSHGATATHSTDSASAQLTSAATVESAVDLGCISSICAIPKLGTIMVVNDTEMVTYTSLSSSSPELVDDQRACRFLMMPSPSQLLTVHERGVKLWRLDNGHLVYATGNDLVKADVSSCAVIVPLQRQFLLGSMEGEVKAFSVALGQQTMDMCPALQSVGLLHGEVLSLHVLPKFRDYTSPYVILTHEDGVTLCPMTEGSFTSAVVRLRMLTALLDNGRFKVKESRLLEDTTRLLISTTRDCVYLVDLAQVSTVVATFSVNAPLENTIFGLFRPLDAFLAHAPPSLADGGVADDAADASQRIEAAEQTAKRRVTVSALAMSIVAQQQEEQQQQSPRHRQSPRARSQSVIAEQMQAMAQRKCRESYATHLLPVLAALSAPHADDAASHEVPAAALSVHRCHLAVADALGNVTVGYSQTVRQVVDGALAAAPRPSRARSLSPRHDRADTPEDRSLHLGEWCAAKNDMTWRWHAATSAVPTRPGVCSSRSAAPSQQSTPPTRALAASRPHRAGKSPEPTSFLTQVSPPATADDTTPVGSPFLSSGMDNEAGHRAPARTHALPSAAVEGTLAGTNTLVVDTTESRRDSEAGGSKVAVVPVSIRLRRSALPVVTHMHYFATLQLLATGNEVGEVKIWDMAGVFVPAVSGTVTARHAMRYAPVLVHEWHAHKSGFTALLGYDHPHCHLPVLVTAGVDRVVTLWSIDGAVLGTLATGRQLDDATRGSRFALPPFRLDVCRTASQVAEHWGHLLDYLMERGKVMEQRAQASRRGAPPSGRRVSGFAMNNDVPPLSLTLTGRSRRRSSSMGGAPLTSRRVSLNGSQTSFFLTEGGATDMDSGSQSLHSTPLAAAAARTPRILEQTGEAGVGSSRGREEATTGEGALAYHSPCGLPLRRPDDPHSRVSPLLAPREPRAAVSPVMAEAIRKTAGVAKARRTSLTTAASGLTPYTLSRTGVVAKPVATPSTQSLPALVPPPAGAAVHDSDTTPRNWGAMPSRQSLGSQRTAARSSTFPQERKQPVSGGGTQRVRGADGRSAVAGVTTASYVFDMLPPAASALRGEMSARGRSQPQKKKQGLTTGIRLPRI